MGGTCVLFSTRSKEKGEKALQLKQAIAAAGESIMMEPNHSYDPFPIPREDNAIVNPLLDVPIILIESTSRTGSPPISPDSRSISPESVAISTPSSSVSGHAQPRSNESHAQPHTKDSTDILSALNSLSHKSSVLSDMGYYSDSPSTSSPVPSETPSSTVSNIEPLSFNGVPLLDAAPLSKGSQNELIGLLTDRSANHTPSNQSPVPVSPQVMWQGEPSPPASYPPGSHTTAVYPVPQGLPSGHMSQTSANTAYQPSSLHYAPPNNNISFQVMYNNKSEVLPSNIGIPTHYSPYVAPMDINNIQSYNLQSSSPVGLWNVQLSQFVTQLNNTATYN